MKLKDAIQTLFDCGVDCYNDKGPEDEGWQSSKLIGAWNTLQDYIKESENATQDNRPEDTEHGPYAASSFCPAEEISSDYEE